MFRGIVRLLVLLGVAVNLLQLAAASSALKRQQLIFHEPPFENHHERSDQVTERYITQRLDNFDHQNSRTFQMVFFPCVSKSYNFRTVMWRFSLYFLALFEKCCSFQERWAGVYIYWW